MAKERPARTENTERTENRVRFLSWFVQATSRFETLKPHHMHALQAYFQTRGLSDAETAESYDKALKTYGI